MVLGSFSLCKPKYEPTLPNPSRDRATGARADRALLLLLLLPLLLLYCLYEARAAFAIRLPPAVRATAGRAAEAKAVRRDIVVTGQRRWKNGQERKKMRKSAKARLKT